MQTDKTVDSCFILPVLPHKIGNVRDFWDDASEKFRGDTEDRLRGVGIKRILAFLQVMPVEGDFMILFMQSADSLDKTLKEMFATDIEYSKYLKDQFIDFSGVDMSREENVPKLELLTDWTDTCQYFEEKNMLMKPWCYAVPIKQGKTDDAMNFFNELKWSRLGEIEAVLREQNVLRRLAFLQRSPQGDFIVQHILTSQSLDELLVNVTSCDAKICNFVKEGLKNFSGIDFSDQRNVPKVELLFKWDEKDGFKTAEQIIAYTE